MTTNFHKAARDFNLPQHVFETVLQNARQDRIDLNSIYVDSHEFQMTVGAIDTGLFTVVSLQRSKDKSIPIKTDGKWNA